MPEPRVIRSHEVEQLQRAEGVTVASHINKGFGATEISSGITSFDPGRSNTTHYHNAEESVIIIEGEGILLINGEENQVGVGDAAFITPGTHPPPDQHRQRTVPHRLVLRHGGCVPHAGG